MSKRILNRDEAQIIMDNSNNNEVYITQSEAANILNVSRQRINQYVKHPEHSVNLGVINIDEKTKLTLSKVLSFTRRSEYRGKRGKQRKNKLTEQMATV